MSNRDLDSTTVAIIGTGRVARIRARELALRPDAKLAVIAGQPERARELAAEFGVEASGSPEEAVARPDVDAVMVCNANIDHLHSVEAALRGGKHVSVDYPLALSLADAERLYALAEQQRRVLHVEHIDLLSPWFCTIFENLFRVGHLQALHWADMSSRKPGGRDWVFDRSAGPTLLVHASLLSRMIRLAGPVNKLSCREQWEGLTPEGRFQSRITQAQIAFAGGATGQLCDGIGLPAAGLSSQFWVYGTEAALHADDRRQVRLLRGETVEELFLPRREGLFAQDIDWFLRRIVQGGEGYAPQSHVLAVMRAAEQAA